MWIYENHSEEEYRKTISRVEQIVVNFGATYVCNKRTEITTYLRNMEICEEVDLNIYKYKEYYLSVEPFYFEECPFIVITLGDRVDAAFEDSEPFPYNLPDTEIELEVKYSLNILSYPDDYGDATRY